MPIFFNTPLSLPLESIILKAKLYSFFRLRAFVNITEGSCQQGLQLRCNHNAYSRFVTVELANFIFQVTNKFVTILGKVPWKRSITLLRK